MAFDPNNLPMKVREAWQQGAAGWKDVVLRCLEVGINDPNRLADFLFYLNHPERNGAPIKAGDGKSIEQWKYYRAMVKDFIGVQSIPKGPQTPNAQAVNWIYSDAEWEQIRTAWGDEVLAWAKLPPIYKRETKQFDVPSWLAADYKTVIFWKSLEPANTCIASPHKRLQGVALIKDDMDYWEKRWSKSQVGAQVLQSTAMVSVKDYTDLVLVQQLCPESAKLRLQALSKDLMYKMFVGMFQMLGPVGLKGGTPEHDRLTGIIKDLMLKIYGKDA